MSENEGARGPGRGWVLGVAMVGAIALALLLAWRAGWLGGGSVASGVAGTSSGDAGDTQLRAAGMSTELAAGLLAELPGTFHDQDGRERRLAEFRGRPWIASAIYTRCVTVCPRVVEELRALERSRAWGPDTSWRGVLFSLDPAYDQPAVLRAFAASRGLAPARWTLLVPDSAALEPLARSLGLLAISDAAGGIAHTAVFALVGANGRIADRRVGLSLPRGGLAGAWKRPPLQ